VFTIVIKNPKVLSEFLCRDSAYFATSKKLLTSGGCRNSVSKRSRFLISLSSSSALERRLEISISESLEDEAAENDQYREYYPNKPTFFNIRIARGRSYGK
jgi:LPS O-antigen subunit length determinant protein (WzzB/FepE family)